MSLVISVLRLWMVLQFSCSNERLGRWQLESLQLEYSCKRAFNNIFQVLIILDIWKVLLPENNLHLKCILYLKNTDIYLKTADIWKYQCLKSISIDTFHVSILFKHQKCQHFSNIKVSILFQHQKYQYVLSIWSINTSLNQKY